MFQKRRRTQLTTPRLRSELQLSQGPCSFDHGNDLPSPHHHAVPATYTGRAPDEGLGWQFPVQCFTLAKISSDLLQNSRRETFERPVCNLTNSGDHGWPFTQYREGLVTVGETEFSANKAETAGVFARGWPRRVDRRPAGSIKRVSNIVNSAVVPSPR